MIKKFKKNFQGKHEGAEKISIFFWRDRKFFKKKFGKAEKIFKKNFREIEIILTKFQRESFAKSIEKI